MEYEIIDGLRVPKLGLGTWSIGGGSRADPSLDSRSLAALRSALELGYTHFDTAETYAAGQTEELIGRAVRETGTERGALFITTKVAPEHLGYNQVLSSLEGSLRRLRMDYVDLFLIHWPRFGMNLEEAFRGLNKLIRDGRVRHLGVSNFNLKLLRQAKALAESPIMTDQVPYSLSDRSHAKNGVLEHCQQNDILLTAYSPLDQGAFKPGKSVQAIAAARRTTPQQIALAWLIAQPRVITIPMSADPRHQKENLEAIAIQLSAQEMARLTAS